MTADDTLSEGVHAEKCGLHSYMGSECRHHTSYLGGDFDPLLYLVATERNGDIQAFWGRLRPRGGDAGVTNWTPSLPTPLSPCIAGSLARFVIPE